MTPQKVRLKTQVFIKRQIKMLISYVFSFYSKSSFVHQFSTTICSHLGVSNASALFCHTLKWSRTCSSQIHLQRSTAKRASRSHKLLGYISQEAPVKLSLYLGPSDFHWWLVLKTIIYMIFMAVLVFFPMTLPNVRRPPVCWFRFTYSFRFITLHPQSCALCVT